MNKILKNRLERCQWLIGNGYTADLETGFVYNPEGERVGLGKLGERDYLRIRMPRRFDIKQKQVLVHQFVFYYHHRIVVDVINHIDRNPSNNCISNLEESSPLENNWNVTCTGVTWREDIQKWQSQININYKSYTLGYFTEKDDGIKTYQIAKQLRDSFQVDNTISPKEFRNLIKQECMLLQHLG
jgi:hypothetical protein